jgi:hypothetical protein
MVIRNSNLTKGRTRAHLEKLVADDYK